jgi:Family of unknown function (DUF6325)
VSDGPFDYLLVGFPDDRFQVEIVPMLIDLVGLGAVRILDLVVISRDGAGAVQIMEIDDLDDDLRELFFDLDGEYDGVLNDADIALAAEQVAPGHTAVGIVWEDVWAARFADAVSRADGTVIATERLPSGAVQRAMQGLRSA